MIQSLLRLAGHRHTYKPVDWLFRLDADGEPHFEFESCWCGKLRPTPSCATCRGVGEHMVGCPEMDRCV